MIGDTSDTKVDHTRRSSLPCARVVFCDCPGGCGAWLLSEALLLYVPRVQCAVLCTSTVLAARSCTVSAHYSGGAPRNTPPLLSRAAVFVLPWCPAVAGAIMAEGDESFTLEDGVIDDVVGEDADILAAAAEAAAAAEMMLAAEAEAAMAMTGDGDEYEQRQLVKGLCGLPDAADWFTCACMVGAGILVGRR